MTNSRLRVGTSGFGYKDWLGNFYPRACPQSDFLKFYAGKFVTVELDVTFYRLPTPSMVQKWAATVPEGFRFAAKFPQTVTHEGEIADRLNNAQAFCDVMRHMESRLGPLLLQFPYSFRPDQIDTLQKLIEVLPTDLRISVEVRNKSWLGPKLYDLLRSHKIALCQVDHPWMPRITERTADFAYVRFLGDQKVLTEDYSYVRFPHEDRLAWWAGLIQSYERDGIDIYAYFNNHFSGHAPTTAFRLLEILAQKET
jgi:uncharacterized protein YecE (DUF72 family)